MINLNDFSSVTLDDYLKTVDKNTLNDLEKFFFFEKHRLINKWLHYFEIYDRHFSKFRDKEVVVVEIGVFQGGSLQMWKNYFGDKCKIIGIDIDPRCKNYEEDQIEVFIGSQNDKAFLSEFKSKVPKIDILIDDGGHFMNQQIISFEELFSHISEDGIYLCEDLHTSYMYEYGGGYKVPSSYIEYSKNFIDYLHAWYSRHQDLKVNEFTQSAHSVHFYDSIVVVEKRKMRSAISFMTTNE